MLGELFRRQQLADQPIGTLVSRIGFMRCMHRLDADTQASSSTRGNSPATAAS